MLTKFYLKNKIVIKPKPLKKKKFKKNNKVIIQVKPI